MPGLRPDIDPDGLLEYSVVYSDRSLNHMSARFGDVMRGCSELLRSVYGAHAAVIVPGSGSFGMEAVARQLAHEQTVLVVRNGFFSYRWSQILERGITTDVHVVQAQQVEDETQSPWRPAPIEELVAAIHERRPAVVFAPHVETSAGMELPPDYVRSVGEATRAVGALFVLDCIASGTQWIDMQDCAVDVLISAPQKGWSSTPCAGLVMLSERALRRVRETTSSSFSCDLRKWLEIMEAYEGGGHAYHATLPTDGLRQFFGTGQEIEAFGFEAARSAQVELGRRIRALLHENGLPSVAAPGFEASGVIVSYTSEPEIKSGARFAQAGRAGGRRCAADVRRTRRLHELSHRALRSREAAQCRCVRRALRRRTAAREPMSLVHAARRRGIGTTFWSALVLLLFAVLLLELGAPRAQQRKSPRSEPLRGYTIMAGGLGRARRGPSDMWSNTEKTHLEFIEQAKINLVVIEVPYGVSKKHPKSPRVIRLIQKLKKAQVRVWILYPHVLAQSFDLPRQVDAQGKKVEWNCCFNQQATQDWLVENGKCIVQAYEPDGLMLFGLFHQGSACHCELCTEGKSAKDIRSGKNMERFFVRFASELRALDKDLQLGTTSFWSRPLLRALAAIDVLSPVVGIWRPGYAQGRVTKELRRLSSRYGKLGHVTVLPYVKLFLASQTNSKTEDVLGAVDESLKLGQGFFLWGYNPGHSYAKQDYDHAAIRKHLAQLAGRRKR
jgi:aspartate aminotransferase-like enzyme